MLVRELIKIFKEEWLPVDSLLRLDKKTEVTRHLLETCDKDTLLAWDSMPLWRVRGIGPKRAMALWAQGVRPGNLRRHLKLLPDATRVALQYPVMERIPRRLVEQAFLAWVPPGEKGHCIVVGSYRRGKPTSGDVDILYSGKDFDAFMSKLERHLGDRWRLMARGPSKVAGIFSLTPRAAVEVDIWITTPETRAYMLLYATGSKEHNVKMRFIAKHRGYKLNQYGLFKDLGQGKFSEKSLPAKTEREIFDHLKMAWKKPEDR
jgi:DNA polymerase/3'-5' exonuclease PolX